MAVLLVVGLGALAALIYFHEEDPNAPKYVESKKIPLIIPEDVKLTEVSKTPVPPKTASKPAPKAAPTPVKTAPKPAPKAAPAPVKTVSKAPAPAASEGSWIVNVASYTESAPAVKLSKKLTKGGYLSYTTEFMKDGTQWHRVRVGFFTSKDRAKNTANQIKANYGQTGWITKASSAEKQKNLK